MTVPKACPECTEPFTPRGRQIYCTRRCQARVSCRRAKGIDVRSVPVVRQCWWCDKGFKATDRRRLYCSAECGQIVRHMANNVWSKYGITRDDYRQMYRDQGGLCAICRRPERSSRNSLLCVDHSHQTGEVRGLLCSQCNRALGLFGDEPLNLAQALRYLNAWAPELRRSPHG